MNKLSIRHIVINKISKRDEKAMIEKMRAAVKKDPAVIEKFKEYGVPLDKIDKVDISFKEMDVSAKTKDTKIYLNKKMFDDGDDPTHYVAHELVHFLQQSTGNTEGHDATDDYMQKETELEAFNTQYDFKERFESKQEADEYVDDLLDYHDKDGKERKVLEKKIKE